MLNTDKNLQKDISDGLRWLVIALSAVLIVFISIDTFLQKPFLTNPVYMKFQFWMCIVFMAEFFVQAYLSGSGMRYVGRNILFLLVSIPYLNVIQELHVDLDPQELYYIRFVPLLRAAFAMAIVISYVSTNKIVGLFWSYVSIVLLSVYFASLIFFQEEGGINPGVPSYWSSLWWCCLEATTIGAPVNPLTVVGKVLAAVLSVMGVVTFPLFTVYLGNIVSRYISLGKRAKVG